jgi:hypothetical protein
MSGEVHSRRPIGPSITYTGGTEMAKLATTTEWVDVDDGNGTRRLVVEGQPIPPGVGVDEADGEEVDTRSLSRPTVDEESSKSYAERTGTEPPTAGTSTENADSRSGGAKRGGGGGSKRAAAAPES